MVTSQKDQIQSLIADIEQVLGKEKPRTPWVKASDVAPQRQALVRAQAYLMSLQQSFEAPGGWGPVDPTTGQIATAQSTPQSGNADSTGIQSVGAQSASSPAVDLPPVGKGQGARPNAHAATDVSAAENVLQALLTEMSFLKSSALQPLRQEMDSLREERDDLSQEVKALSEQRNQALQELNQAQLEQAQLAGAQAALMSAEGSASAAATQIDEQQLNEFLQVLMSRLQENLSVQVTETLGQLESEHSAAMAKLTAATEIEILELKPTGQIEEMRQIQSRSDQLLANIDSTLQRMFETLQTNIDSYQISLNEGIENMHSLGRQGEVIVRSLVDHLTQQLGQTAPPEPVFYPGPPSAFAEPENPDAVSANADTVSSLNEILPAVSSYEATADLRSADVSDDSADVSDDSADVSDDNVLDGVSDGSVAEAPMASDPMASDVEPVSDSFAMADMSPSDGAESDGAESDGAEVSDLDESSGVVGSGTTSDATPIEEVPAENFIKEDGTIDLDLLKLDIDRTEDDSSLSRDDLMIDAAVADARVAAAEAENQENLEIEAKIKPTADAAFLADLTFDDLVVDDEALGGSLSDSAPIDAPEVPVAEVPVTEIPVPDLVLEQELDSEPENSEPDTRPDSASVPDTPKDDSSVDEELSGAPEQIDEAPSDDLVAVLDAANAEAERTAIESANSDLDSDLGGSDLEEERVFDAPVPSLTPLSENAEPPESAVIPEQPIEDRPEELASAPARVKEGNIEEGDTEQEDPQVDLWASAEEFNANANVDTTSSDETPLAATQFPPSESFEAALQDLDLPEASAGASTEADLQETDLPDLSVPPVDFDDDLDAFPSDVSAGHADTVLPPSADMASAIGGPAIAAGMVGKLGESSDVELEIPGADSFADDLADGLDDSLLNDNLLDDNLLDDNLAAPLDSSVNSAAADLSEPTGSSTGQTVIQPPEDEGDDDPTGGEPADWFLGIDLGATGLSAVLINQRGEQVYPLCWNATGESESNRFRLPAVVQIEPEAKSGSQLGAVGEVALQAQSPLLRNLKLMVKAGIPRETSGEPWMQWSDHTSLPLATLQASIVELLSTLRADRMGCRAVGLKNAALSRALKDIKGVIVGYPTNWPDTYSFNIREAVVASGLIASPSQIFFVEEAIAALLSALPASAALQSASDNQQPGLYNCNWSGGTVIISAGAVLTETAVANLPADLDQLSYQHFSMRGYTYAGDAIDQDIICQLLHMPLPESRQDKTGEPADSIGRWETLGLSEIALPQPGEADRVTRHRLRQRLNDSPLGREALLTARELKMALQEEEEVEVELGDHTWVITRKELETKVFLPYIQRINRQVNALLSKQNLATQTVKQVVCTGGSASLGTIARWLRQKFPNATIIQDTYAGEYSNSCSRVAYGLANLCHYPKVLDVNRHQYNDYFLLLELLRILPEQPLPAGGILHLLEQRGINTQACQAHVLALIEGHLPPGLVPTSGDRPLISARATDIATYKALSELPLFRKQGGQIYIADQKQGARLRSHLEALLSTKAQSLSEPMSAAALLSATVQA